MASNHERHEPRASSCQLSVISFQRKWEMGSDSDSYRKSEGNRKSEDGNCEIGNRFVMVHHLPLALACGKMNALVTWA